MLKRVLLGASDLASLGVSISLKLVVSSSLFGMHEFRALGRKRGSDVGVQSGLVLVSHKIGKRRRGACRLLETFKLLLLLLG